jgi:tRNA G18 (ribose-2'-O)-methylase SpoU
VVTVKRNPGADRHTIDGMHETPAYQATTLAEAYAWIDRLPVRVWLENVRSLYNVGSFFRTADAVRAEALIVGGITPSPDDPRIAKTALGAEATVRWSRCTDTIAALDQMRADGRDVVAIETSLHAVDIFDWQPRFPVCVVFGHEVDGLSPTVLERCDTHVRIPTLGLKQSINVATAGGVVLYELLRKYRALQPGLASASGVSSPPWKTKNQKAPTKSRWRD